MSSIAPLFTTAPRIKIFVGGVQVAFAVGLNISASVDVTPVNIVGKFGPVSLEPTQYNPISGTMQIISVISKDDLTNTADLINNNVATDGTLDTALAQVASFDELGNIIYSDASAAAAETNDSNNPIAQSGLIRHMDPRTVLLSRTFDLDLYMKVPDSSNADVQTLLNSSFSDDGGINGADPALFKEVPWLSVKNCRITSRNINIAQGQLTNEPVSFMGTLLTSKTIEGVDIMKEDNGAPVVTGG